MRAPACAPRVPAEEAAGEESESLRAHAGRVLRARLGAMARGVLDPAIALLQRLRKRAGGAQDADAEAEEDEFRPRKARPGGGHDATARADEDDDAEEAEAPKRKSRLLAFLIYVSVLLAGSMAGGALAYELLAKLLQRQAVESQRLALAVSKQSKSAAAYEKTLEEAKTKRAEAEKKREDAEKMIEEAKKKQTEAEAKLATALNDSRVAADKQRKLDEAVRLLDSIRRADRAGDAQRASPLSPGGGESKPKSGDCTLAAGNINALKDCVQNFNR